MYSVQKIKISKNETDGRDIDWAGKAKKKV